MNWFVVKYYDKNKKPGYYSTFTNGELSAMQKVKTIFKNEIVPVQAILFPSGEKANQWIDNMHIVMQDVR